MRHVDILNATSTIEGEVAHIREIIGNLEGKLSLAERISHLIALKTKIENIEIMGAKLNNRVKEEGFTA